MSGGITRLADWITSPRPPEEHFTAIASATAGQTITDTRDPGLAITLPAGVTLTGRDGVSKTRIGVQKIHMLDAGLPNPLAPVKGLYQIFFGTAMGGANLRATDFAAKLWRLTQTDGTRRQFAPFPGMGGKIRGGPPTFLTRIDYPDGRTPAVTRAWNGRVRASGTPKRAISFTCGANGFVNALFAPAGQNLSFANTAAGYVVTLTDAERGVTRQGDQADAELSADPARDAAPKRIADMLAKGEPLPVDFTNRVIYYVGPVYPVRDEVVGPAGPTTATHMDKFTRAMLDKTSLISMIGKAERGPEANAAIRDNKAAYLMAVRDAAYLVPKAIEGAKVVGFADLGMDAIYEFEVKHMPVTVAVVSSGTSAHQSGPKDWKVRFGKIPLATA